MRSKRGMLRIQIWTGMLEHKLDSQRDSSISLLFIYLHTVIAIDFFRKWLPSISSPTSPSTEVAFFPIYDLRIKINFAIEWRKGKNSIHGEKSTAICSTRFGFFWIFFSTWHKKYQYQLSVFSRSFIIEMKWCKQRESRTGNRNLSSHEKRDREREEKSRKKERSQSESRIWGSVERVREMVEDFPRWVWTDIDGIFGKDISMQSIKQ